MLQEIDFLPITKRKGSFFLGLTMFHHFAIMKNDINELFHLPRPYNFAASSKRINDMEGFYARLMKRVVISHRGDHQFDDPKDVIRNDEDIKSQRNKKSYWHTYMDMLREIHEDDPAYDPLPNCKN